jgi:hypothetical protein
LPINTSVLLCAFRFVCVASGCECTLLGRKLQSSILSF